MIQVGATELIHAEVEDVFRTMARLDTLHLWLVGCVEAWSISENPYEVGARVGHIDEVMGQRFEAHYEVVVWDEPARLVFRTLSGGPFSGTSELRFAAEGHATRVDISIEGELRGAFRFGEWAARKVAQKQLAESVQNAKTMIESHPHDIHRS